MRRAVTAVAALATFVAVGAAAAPAASSAAPAEARSAAAAEPQWPGHQPGKVLLGMSCGSQCGEKRRQLDQSYGVHRWYARWGDWRRVAKLIEQSHSADRLPWVSVKGPQHGSPRGWRAVARGQYDSAIRTFGRTLKAHDDKPVLITFQHEPQNDGSEAEGADWAAAYSRFHDVLKNQGALRNVADPPILGDWLFNPINKRMDPANWARPNVLRRAPFIGIDMYENKTGDTFAQRLPRILDWMADRGYPDMMVGIGETGATSRRYSAKSAVEWIDEALTWATNHPDKIGVVSYFNSTAYSRDGVYWPLDESWAKLRTFRDWLDHPRIAS